MPRQSRRSAPAPASRSAPARSAPAPAPARTSAAHPSAAAAAPRSVPAQQQAQHAQVPATIPQSQGPGILGQIAANTVSMAAGSTIARGVSHALGWDGSGSHAAAPAAADPQSVNPPTSNGYGDLQSSSGFQQDSYGQQGAQTCELFATDFRNCLSATKGDPTPCQYYLDQFRACSANMST
ncbi:hypothetical protein P389DRAFT_208513 [Cystobasidium minutum MCA 4210]|uniref:uncharacterized protein n=1 Tax=Cystobasidium minutum MCA 4210 TaxID=1397322 RepID=UPI0034CD6E49|eukprot:jgi/Rhomi1/208513/estExt_Genemark1.C_2_t10196